MSVERRRQCAKCPWKKSTNPRDIPGGYSEQKHAALRDTITSGFGPLRMMACHETPPGKELPCVGWLAHQLGPGNNLWLRLAVISGRVDGGVETVGEQHETFDDTLPKKRRRSKRSLPLAVVLRYLAGERGDTEADARLGVGVAGA